MPELPDVILYVNSLNRLLNGAVIQSCSVRSPFVLRTFSPELEQANGSVIVSFFHIGKRIVWELEPELYLVFHPMIAGRFHWKNKVYRPTGKNDLLAIVTDRGTMVFTEASPKKRAGLWVQPSRSDVSAMDAGGIDVLNCSCDQFSQALMRGNNTLKRALTDPTRFCGIGNAYSDEILHRARLSPLQRTENLKSEQLKCLWKATSECLHEWIDRLAAQNQSAFPEKVTAFRPEMRVHGKYGQACVDCGKKVQRIRYADNECNYCAACQTGGKLLADRSLSRLLKDDWPKSIDDLE
ncbi:MAG: DNA-formamidopyrimidine glycosylase family protein [Pirellulaceae bacterium]